MTIDEACNEVVKYRKLAKAAEAMLEACLPESVSNRIHYDGQRASVSAEYFRAKTILTEGR